MEVSQYIQILEPTSGIDNPMEDNEALSSELLDVAIIEPSGFEDSSALAEYNWPEVTSRRRSRHSYNYYNLNSN